MNKPSRLILIAVTLAACVMMMGASKASKVYENAENAMYEGDFTTAAQLFDSISGYEDATRLAMYCKAYAYAAEGSYKEAVKAFQSFGDYRDSAYNVTYYQAAQGAAEAEATNDPGTWLDAAALYDSISLFKDSLAKADACRQAVYDIASEKMTESYSSVDEARMYFQMLDGFSDSAVQLEACEKILQITLEPETPFIQAGNSAFLMQYTDYDLYRKDKTASEIFIYFVCVSNQGKDSSTIKVEVSIDGEKYHWNPIDLEPSASKWFSFSSDEDTFPFVVGDHTVVWYVNGLEYASYNYSVYRGKSAQKQSDEQAAKNISLDMNACHVNTVTQNCINSRGDVGLRNLFLDKLQDSECLEPTCDITNNGTKTAEFKLTLCLDSSYYSWDASIASGKTQGFYVSSAPLTPGQHTAKWYYNNVLIQRQTFTVYETMAEAEEQKLALTAVADEDIEFEDTQVWEYIVGFPTGWQSNSVEFGMTNTFVTIQYDEYLDQFSDIYVEVATQEFPEEYASVSDLYADYESNLGEEIFVASETEDILLNGEPALLIHGTLYSTPAVVLLYKSGQSGSLIAICSSSEDHASCAKMMEFICSHISIGTETKTSFRERMEAKAAAALNDGNSNLALKYCEQLTSMGYTVDPDLLRKCNPSSVSGGSAPAVASTEGETTTYTASAQGISSDVVVTATISNGKILNVTLDVSGETAGIGAAAGEKLAEQFMAAQSSDIDGVAGASITSAAAKKAMGIILAGNGTVVED